MYKLILILFISTFSNGQSVDKPILKKKMRKDFDIFKKISKQANSGIYKYRTQYEIDSIYNWGDIQIEKIEYYREFYDLINTISDFEGSLHNDISLSKKYTKDLRKESYGYFPLPIKWINDKWIINIDLKEIPLGSEILTINNIDINEIIPKLYKYYSTDGINLTGKRVGLMTNFSKYYRLNFGLCETFNVNYLEPKSNQISTIKIKSVSYKKYYENFRNIHSIPLDKFYYSKLKDSQKYNYKQLDPYTGILTIHTFNLGDETTINHKKYKAFLDSTFVNIKNQGIKNLIVDVRNNGGGTDPNDLITYSYLTNRNYQENKDAWINFRKIPLLKYIDHKIPKLIRPLFVGKFNKELEIIFPTEKNNKFYQSENSNDHIVRKPNQNAFNGNVFLLISPKTASAGSLFASMLSGNKNTITIGEETMGGYYGHNGHTSLRYKLPNSKIMITFSIVNLEQDVPIKENQKYNRGIIPDYEIIQTYDDFLNNIDTQMNFTLELIKNNQL